MKRAKGSIWFAALLAFGAGAALFYAFVIV
jgi:hypothetical protein